MAYFGDPDPDAYNDAMECQRCQGDRIVPTQGALAPWLMDHAGRAFATVDGPFWFCIDCESSRWILNQDTKDRFFEALERVPNPSLSRTEIMQLFGRKFLRSGIRCMVKEQAITCEFSRKSDSCEVRLGTGDRHVVHPCEKDWFKGIWHYCQSVHFETPEVIWKMPFEVESHQSGSRRSITVTFVGDVMRRIPFFDEPTCDPQLDKVIQEMSVDTNWDDDFLLEIDDLI